MRRQRLRGVLRPCKAGENASDRRSGPHTVGPEVRLIAEHNFCIARPDGTVVGTFDGGKSINGPWGMAIDGNDNVWVANSTGHSVAHLCGARPENCPPGAKTGDPISPPGGYIGGLQTITDVAIDPAGNVWVANNWDMPEQVGFKKVPEPALSTRFGGNGTVVFFGLAKPVLTPLIGPPRQP